MRSSVRAFGIGIFIAGASFAIYEQLMPTEKDKNEAHYIEQIEQYESKIVELEKQLTGASVEGKKGQSDQTEGSPATKDSSANESSTTSTDEHNGEIVTATIYIYENVTLYSIGQQVEDEGIIENGRELELFLAKPEYSRSIQKGAFDLRSDMTIEQIAKVLTGKKIN
ncbi:MAG: hypothetical protein ABS944_04330 [Solibacillus sp.]|uniref:hypothetical protein n=1 Tax=Solibacillus sp. TaxID=1909654 RepID=UPI003315F6FE